MTDFIFNEAEYLASNPDVAAAVKNGMFRSGLEHYTKYGESEGRMLKRIFGNVSREEKIFYLIEKTGLGLEIGPSHNPIAPKNKGFNVHILDHASTAELRDKYQGHGVNLDNIEEVDFVWHGEKLQDLIGKTGYYDWIIAKISGTKQLGESIDRGMRLLVSTTRAPMRLVTALSLFGAVANLVYSVYVVAIALLKVDVSPGWVSLSLQQSGMFLLISLVLLVLGEYILNMVSLQNEGPLYHVGQEFTSARMTRCEKLNIEEAMPQSQKSGAHSE